MVEIILIRKIGDSNLLSSITERDIRLFYLDIPITTGNNIRNIIGRIDALVHQIPDSL